MRPAPAGQVRQEQGVHLGRPEDCAGVHQKVNFSDPTISDQANADARRFFSVPQAAKRSWSRRSGLESLSCPAKGTTATAATPYYCIACLATKTGNNRIFFFYFCPSPACQGDVRGVSRYQTFPEDQLEVVECVPELEGVPPDDGTDYWIPVEVLFFLPIEQHVLDGVWRGDKPTVRHRCA